MALSLAKALSTSAVLGWSGLVVLASPDSFSQFDQQVRQGSVALRIEGSVSGAEPHGARTSITIERSIWPEGRMLERVVQVQTGLPGASGTYRSVVIQESGAVAKVDEARLTSTVERGSSQHADYDWYLGFAAGPSLPLGRGLSLLQDRRQVGLRVTGTASDGTRITATLERLAPPLLKQVERRVSGDTVIVWRYEGWKDWDGVWLPGRVTSQSVGGPETFQRDYTLLDFQKPPPEWPASATNWFRPGYTIVNQSASPPIGKKSEEWRVMYQGQDPTTLEDFLRLSEIATVERDRRVAAGSAQPSTPTGRSWGNTAVAAAGLALAGFFLFVLMRRGLRNE